MKLSLNWLKSYFDPSVKWDEVWEKLTLAGIEIEEIIPVGSDFSNVVVAKVITCAAHPDADKLKVCTVDAGDNDYYQIICGAANVMAGVVVPCAKIGATLPGGLTILERKMRGITSFGMLCAGEEIGLADAQADEGLLLLPLDAPIGMSIRDYFDLDDKIVEFKITPNRGDCLSLKGIIREITLVTGYLAREIFSNFTFYNSSDSIEIENKVELEVPAYATLTLKNVNNQGQLPVEIMRRLERSGIKAISPVVDLTNYVMLETGQPLHAFDLAKVGNKVIIRKSTNGEQIKLLNESMVTLTNNTVIIANKVNEPIAIAGVMGGGDSGVTTTTTDILLECAFFEPSVIQGIAKYYKAFSESATRFERGVDYSQQKDVIRYIAYLIQKYCGGEIGALNMIFEKDLFSRAKTIAISINKIKQFIGAEIDEEEIIQILTLAQLSPSISDGVISITVPCHRFDLNIPEDIIEEVARIYGYDNIPATLPQVGVNFAEMNTLSKATCNLKNIMIDNGFTEIISYAFVEEKLNAQMGNPGSKVLRLINPIANLNVMRTSLIADLVKTLKYNLNHGQHNVRLFQIGRVFYGESIEKQPLKLAGLMYGAKETANGINKPEKVDFYTLKKVVENILGNMPDIAFAPCKEYKVLHSGRCAKIYAGTDEIGIIGQLHPKLSQELAFNMGPYVFELSIEKLKCQRQFTLKALCKFPRVERDLAFVINNDIPVANIISSIKDLAKTQYLIECQIFDIYTKAEEGSKSVAINCVFQGEKTLTEEEIKSDSEIIIQFVCEKFNATLRK